jgi:CelD/BcsL family acetyltransferase involved in cellulose biosynthesis
MALDSGVTADSFDRRRLTNESPASSGRASALGTAQLLRADALTGEDVDAWTRLADATIEPNPFFRPEFVLSSLAGRTNEALLLVVPSADGWAACLPLARARRWGRHHLPVLKQWLPQFTYLATPLVAADLLESAVAAVADFVMAERQAAALVLDPVDLDGPVARALWPALAARAGAPITYYAYERAALRRRPELTYLDEAASTRRRRELRRRWRVLGKQLEGEPQTVDRADNAAAYDDFLALEHDSWKGEEGTALACTPADAAFFRQMCGRMAAAGRLQLLDLHVDGTTTAMQVNFADGEGLFRFKHSFNRHLARPSPGALLEVEAIRIFHERTELVSFDSCTGEDNTLMNSLWPDRRRVATVLIPTGAPRAKLLPPSLRVEAGARRAVRAARHALSPVRGATLRAQRLRLPR